MYKVKRFSQMTEIQQRQYGLLGNFKKAVKKKAVKFLDKKVNNAHNELNRAQLSAKGIIKPGYETVSDPKISKNLIKNARKMNTRVMKSNRPDTSSMRHSNEFNEELLSSEEHITSPRGIKKVMNATKSNDKIIMMGDNYSRSTDSLAHEIGHAKNSVSKNPIVKRIHDSSGSELNSSDKGLYQIARHIVKNKLRINEEARASRNAMKMLKKAGATEEQLKRSRKNLDYGLETYKAGSKLDNLTVLRNTVAGEVRKEDPVNIMAIKRRD